MLYTQGMITSIHDEGWDLMNRGTDDQNRPICHVRHIQKSGHVTVYRLLFRPTRGCPEGKWHHIGLYSGMMPKVGYRPTPEKHGKALSGSRQDLILLSFAEHGHGNAYN